MKENIPSVHVDMRNPRRVTKLTTTSSLDLLFGTAGNKTGANDDGLSDSALTENLTVTLITVTKFRILVAIHDFNTR